MLYYNLITAKIYLEQSVLFQNSTLQVN